VKKRKYKFPSILVLSLNLIFWSRICSYASDICVPNYYAPDAMVYFAERMNTKLVVFLNGLQNEKTAEFRAKLDAPEKDTDGVFRQFRSLNPKIEMIVTDQRKVIFCSAKKQGKDFNDILEATVTYEKPANYLLMPDGKRINLRMSGLKWNEVPASYDDSKFLKSEIQWKVPCKFSDYLVGLMDEHSFRSCIIKRTSKVPTELREFIEIQTERKDAQISSDKLKALSEYVKNSESNAGSNIELEFSEDRFTKEPSPKQLSLYLRQSEKTMDVNSPEWLDNPFFWITWHMTSDSVEFMEFLLENKLFDNTSESKLYLISIIPSILASRSDMNGIRFLLENLHDIKSLERKGEIIEAFRNIDKNTLDEKSRDIFVSYAREFGIEDIYLDTSKWIGDDLPDDYDRWRGFKIPDTELLKEEKISLAGKEFTLKYYKYKEAFRIGGIPLKKFEECDWTTPEKAYISALCARDKKWRNASIYQSNNIPFDTYSPSDNWKPWHAGLKYFTEIIFKVEIKMEQSDSIPSVFLICYLLDVNGKIVATPMAKEEDSWKTIISWDYMTSELSKHVLSSLKDNL